MGPLVSGLMGCLRSQSSTGIGPHGGREGDRGSQEARRRSALALLMTELTVKVGAECHVILVHTGRCHNTSCPPLTLIYGGSRTERALCPSAGTDGL